MTEIWIVFGIIAAVIALFVWDRLPVIAVCVGVRARALGDRRADHQPEPRRVRRSGEVFVAALFVASAALERTGVTAWAGRR